jgi:hypothetical protein
LPSNGWNMEQLTNNARKTYVNQANWRSATDQWLEKASQIGRRAAAEVLSARRYAARPCRLAPHHTLESKPPHRCPRPLSVHYSTPAASVPSAATESCSNRARACRSCVDLVKDLGPTIGVRNCREHLAVVSRDASRRWRRECRAMDVSGAFGNFLWPTK